MATAKKTTAVQAAPEPDDLLQKAEIHRDQGAQTTAQKAAAVSRVVEQPAQNYVAQGINPFANDPAYQQMRTIFMPFARGDEGPNADITLNGVRWKMPRGRPVTVPLPVYEQFERILEAEQAEIRMHNQMAAGMDSAHFGMGYLIGEQPV